MTPTTLPAPARRLLCATVLLAGAAGAHAAPGDALERCIDLAPAHQIVRSGDSQHFLLKSGDDHYKVAFQRSCSSLPMASRVVIAADGQPGRLCPGSGVVDTSREQCSVGEVTQVSAEDFQRQQRRRRR